MNNGETGLLPSYRKELRSIERREEILLRNEQNLARREQNLARRERALEKRVRLHNEWLKHEVKCIIEEELQGNSEAFAAWLHIFYLHGLDGTQMEDFGDFLKSALAFDIIHRWRNDCKDDSSRVELLGQIYGSWSAPDFEKAKNSG